MRSAADEDSQVGMRNREANWNELKLPPPKKKDKRNLRDNYQLVNAV